MKFSEFWTMIQVRKWGKYVVTLLIFVVIYLFIGDQSLIRFIRRGSEIRHLEEQRDTYLQQTEEAQQQINMLSQKDSLERFAREQYYMHEKGEDIYLVEENNK